MAVKKCCIENCNSCSTRQEDVGVTYHKLPKDITLRDIWITVTRHANSDPPSYVCSRHFCKSDFQMYKDSKYVLKSDAVPSIFSWTMSDIAENKTNSEENMEVDDIFGSNKNQEETLKRCSKDSDENVDAIKKFIEDQEKEISTLETEVKPIENVAEILESNQEKTTDNIVDKTEGAVENEVIENIESVNTGNTENQQIETMAVASSVMDMILSESEAKIAERKETKAKENMSQAEKANCMALSVGSKVEAKDFGEYWHPAQITEVDYDEMEVLVHYEHTTKKHDEWISVSSPRLRPVGSGTPNPPSTPIPEEHGAENTPRVAPTATPVVKEEIKHEEKQKVTFAVGERCLARWRDNRRFVATISEDLGDGKYEIMFDDGVRWSCTTTRLCKLKEPSKRDSLSVDTTYQPAGSSTLSPVYGPGPSNVATATPLPAYHTHLFDPTRDYLGSKSERREMKRKLNIKEIFNIGQKKKKIETPKITTEKVKAVKEKKPKVVRKRIKTEPVAVKMETEVKKEVPDAVASIIGTEHKDVAVTEEVKENVTEGDKEEVQEPIKEEAVEEIMEEEKDDLKEEIIVQEIDVDSKIDIDDTLDIANSETLSAPESQDMKHEDDPVLYEKTTLEKFEQPDDAEREEVIDRIKEVITKLEDGLNEVDVKPESVDSLKLEMKDVVQETPVISEPKSTEEEKPKKNLTKVKKGKKLRLLQEKKVKKQVERVKNELEAMKKQMEEMRKQMLQKTEEIAKSKTHRQTTEMPDSFLLPGEWCCKWVNGQPVGTVSEMESEVKVDANNRPALPRRSVQVEDTRLPEGWTKHMVRRSLGHSAGKWDVVLVSPDNRRFHTKTDMRLYLENVKDSTLKPYEYALFDFGVHLKLSRRMGWYTTTPDGIQTPASLPAGTLSSTSPLVKRKSLSLKKKPVKLKEKKRKILKIKKHDRSRYTHAVDYPGTSAETATVLPPDIEHPPLEEGYVYVGSLKVQVIDNLLRCPAEGCLKNFRNNTLLKMHIKHYHRELRKMLGATPKVLDLAYARARPTQIEMRRLKLEAQAKTIRVKLPKLAKRLTEPKPEVKQPEQAVEAPALEGEKIPRSQDSPKLRNALVNKPVKRPRVLLPVRRPEQEMVPDLPQEDDDFEDGIPEPIEIPIEPLDFETAISTHTVTKPPDFKRKDKKRKSFASVAKRTASEDDEWFGVISDVETRSSFPRSGTPDSKDQKLVSSESNEEQKDSNYMYTETGERIKIVHMKREEIINCHCGFREEDGLMVQCELCLCWQHALCHNIQRESEVPEKYTCSICLNPRRGRRSQRFLHDQDRLYEGLLPGAKPCESLRRSHELSGNLLKIEDALHALRVKYYVATKKDHPKLYLWAKDWETGELNMTQEKLNSDYSDLNIIISNIGKENLPIKPEEMSQMSLGIRTPPSEDPELDRFSQKENQLGSQSLLSGFLSSPGGASLDLPISTSELERLAKTVQAEQSLVLAPEPEAAIEDGACRQRLLRHLTRCQALLDARLDSIEAQVAELESQDPSFEDDETADYFPRTKQTIQMLLRDLDTMEELGVIT